MIDRLLGPGLSDGKDGGEGYSARYIEGTYKSLLLTLETCESPLSTTNNVVGPPIWTKSNYCHAQSCFQAVSTYGDENELSVNWQNTEQLK